MKEPSQLRYNLQHDTHCNKSLISRSKFMSLYVLKVFILTDQISYPSNTDFPNFPKLNCSVNGQDTGLSADRSPHNVLVMAELILRDRDMADLWEQGSSLVLQSDSWVLSPALPLPSLRIFGSAHLCSAETRGLYCFHSPVKQPQWGEKWSKWLNLTRYRST